MRKVMLLAAMLAMVLAAAVPAFAQANAVQYDGDDATFCNQVQAITGITQAQYGDANAAATDESEAIAEAANELNVSQDQVLNCFVGNEDVSDVNQGGATDGDANVGDVGFDDDEDGVVDEEFEVVTVDGVDNDADGVVDEGDGTEVEAAATASATAEATATAAAEEATATAAAEEASATAAAEGELPETGGASLLALGAGALLVAGGLLARRIVR